MTKKREVVGTAEREREREREREYFLRGQESSIKLGC
jgi:hypothetical protein